MARGGRGGPADRAWRAAVLLGLALLACQLAWALLVPVVFGDGCPCRDQAGRQVLVLATSGDFWVAPAAARYVANGALGFVYESSRHLTALPLYPILLAPLVAVSQALRLSEPPAPTPTMWFLLAPFTVGLAVPLLHQVRGLVRDTGGGALSAQVWTAVLVAVPVLVVFGHGEDALALLGVLAAVRLAAREHWAEAGLLLGLAVASKQWALLALPALLARCSSRERGRLAAACLALPAALALFVLAVDWAHASRALLHPPNYPGYGHAALWVPAGAATVATAPFRLGALALAVALAARSRGGTGTSRLLAVLGVTLLARCAFEPVVHVYYLGPGLCLLLLHERVTTGRSARTAVLGGLLVAWFEVRPAPALWWAVAASLGVAVAYRAGREALSATAPAPSAPAGGDAAAAATGRAAGTATGVEAATSGSAGAASGDPAAARTTGPAAPPASRGRATAVSDSSATGSHQ
jgi:hypothetical protein